jgi:hypothetical protein
MFLYICLPGISNSIFRTYPCQDVDPDDDSTSGGNGDDDGTSGGDSEYMRSDYSISCSSSRYLFGIYWATVMIIIYPIGIPLLFLILLYQQKETIIHRPHTLSLHTSATSRATVGTILKYQNHEEGEGDEEEREGEEGEEKKSHYHHHWKSKFSKLQTQDIEIILRPLRVLYASYLPNFWYWEIFETYFRLFFTGFLVLISQGSILQIILGIIIILFFLQLYNSYQPYLNKSHQFIKILTIWQIYFLLFFSLLLRCNIFNRTDDLFAIAIVLIILVSFIYDLVGLVMCWIEENSSDWWWWIRSQVQWKRKEESDGDDDNSRRGRERRKKRNQKERKIISELKKQKEVNLEIKKTQEKLSILETISREIHSSIQELSGDVEEERGGISLVIGNRNQSRSISNPLREIEAINL